MDFSEIALTRQSCRSYDAERMVESEKIEAILETARLAPSACNSQPYFITVCTHNKQHYFGEINNGEIFLSSLGIHLSSELEKASIYQSCIKVLQYVIMPNHFHAILKVSDSDSYSDTIEIQRVNTLSKYIKGVKASVTKLANKEKIQFSWQKSYHDHFIRGIDDLNNISDYISNNVLAWESDCFY